MFYYPYNRYIKKGEAKRAIKQHNTLIAVVLLFTLLTFSWMYSLVVPKLLQMFADLGLTPPISTRLLPYVFAVYFGLSTVVATYIFKKPLDEKQLQKKLAKYKANEMIPISDVVSFGTTALGFGLIASYLCYFLFSVLTQIYQLTG